MGRGDNRRTLKMRRRTGQAKKKQRRATLLAAVGSATATPKTSGSGERSKQAAVKKTGARTTIKRPRPASSGATTS